MIRKILERLSRGKSVRRRLPATFGRRPIYLSPDSALQYLKPNWANSSQDLLAAAERFVQPQSTIWDIGANVGVFAFASAHIVGSKGTVIAVEADPFLASLLQRTVGLPTNQDLNVNVICVAISDQIGMARFMIANRGRSSNSLEEAGHRSQADGTRYTQFVPTFTLDSLALEFPPPDLVKIDVEGGEVLVLQGAEQVLSKHRPIFYIEVGKEQDQKVTNIFKSNNYKLFDGDSMNEVELKNCCRNTFAVPAESTITNRGIAKN